MAYGNVYVFNLYGSAATQVNINDQGSAGSIAAPTKGAKSPYYAPQQLAVARTNLTPDQLNNPLFCNGPNTVKVNYDGYTWSGKITIPGPATIPLQNDLWLYLAYGQMFLFDTNGALQPQPAGPSAMLRKAASPVGATKGGGAKGGAAKGGAKGGAKGAAKKSSGKK
ncbi:MAG: hypothetical protein LC795_15165 [Acidobacteria bacterium]|nr:hypothetical protein [Acidobacteriota bacterium]MCA1620616.1 hypothetical protein [Acidobacteriota bacterium]